MNLKLKNEGGIRLTSDSASVSLLVYANHARNNVDEVKVSMTYEDLENIRLMCDKIL